VSYVSYVSDTYLCHRLAYLRPVRARMLGTASKDTKSSQAAVMGKRLELCNAKEWGQSRAEQETVYRHTLPYPSLTCPFGLVEGHSETIP
jgi:hypothetical protein